MISFRKHHFGPLCRHASLSYEVQTTSLSRSRKHCWLFTQPHIFIRHDSCLSFIYAAITSNHLTIRTTEERARRKLTSLCVRLCLVSTTANHTILLAFVAKIPADLSFDRSGESTNSGAIESTFSCTRKPQIKQSGSHGATRFRVWATTKVATTTASRWRR